MNWRRSCYLGCVSPRWDSNRRSRTSPIQLHGKHQLRSNITSTDFLLSKACQWPQPKSRKWLNASPTGHTGKMAMCRRVYSRPLQGGTDSWEQLSVSSHFNYPCTTLSPMLGLEGPWATFGCDQREGNFGDTFSLSLVEYMIYNHSCVYWTYFPEVGVASRNTSIAPCANFLVLGHGSARQGVCMAK